MKFDWFDICLGALLGFGFTVTGFAIIGCTHEHGQITVWRKAVKAGVAVLVDGEYEFVKEKK